MRSNEIVQQYRGNFTRAYCAILHDARSFAQERETSEGLALPRGALYNMRNRLKFSGETRNPLKFQMSRFRG